MPSFQADPENFVELLQIVRDGYVISLEAGEYKGPFIINSAITICGKGANTVIFAVDEPALVVKVPGVRLENLAVARTVGGDAGEIAISATIETSPICKSVILTGVAPNVEWEGASWDLPTMLDFGEIETNRQVERSWQIQLGAPCKILSEVNWLRVQNSRLYPGLQNLQIVLNSSDILAGTILSSSIFLEAEDSTRVVEINALIKAKQSKNLQINHTSNNHQEWGYKFVSRRGIDKFIFDIKGEDTLNKYPEKERKKLAETLLSDMLGKGYNLFYIRRQQPNQRYAKAEIWELTLASDRYDSPLPKILQQRDKTLHLLATISTEDGEDCLNLRDASLLALPKGRVDGFALPYYLQLSPNRLLTVSQDAIAQIKSLPFWGDRHIPTEQQLQVWHTFLDIEERVAKARQFCVPFGNHNYGVDTRRVTFEIDVTAATLDGYSENALDANDFWERAKKARNEDLTLLDSENSSKREVDKLGSITDIDAHSSKIRIRLDSDLVERITQGRYQIPQNGFLCFEAAGDINQILRKRHALENLKKGRSQNIYLSKFLFDASLARLPIKPIKLQPQDLLKRDANPDQIAAVETVLSSPDMVLIQGPPGTGKTTVIAEICYQIALRGGKTLIASQANLAVDNALSRLVHNPVIRALRKGKADRVQEEGQPFLEDNVIGTWLQNTADDCENNLLKRQQNVETFQKLLKSSQRFTAYLQAEEEFQKQQKQLQKQKTSLESSCKQQETAYSEVLSQINELETLISGLTNILNTVPNINWKSSEVANFLPLLKPYTEGNILVENFVANVRTAINKATELGFVRPARGAFGLAVWLHETVATEISQFRAAFSYVENAATAMSEVAESVQIFRQNSASLIEAQKDYQQILATQQNLEPKLKNLEKRKNEIDFVISAVREWKSTANSRLYQILNHCRQTGELFRDDLLQLPSGLWMLSRSLSLPLVPANYKINKIEHLPNWLQLTNALTYETEGDFIDRRGKQSRFSEFLHQSLSQIPIVLSTSDRVKWLEIVKQFKNYPHLNLSQRQILVENTQQFLSQMQQLYGAVWQQNNIKSTLNQITHELLESILSNARKCVSSVKNETEQQLQQVQKQFSELQINATNQQKKISAAQYQVQREQQEGNLKLNQVINLLQELKQQQTLPEKLGILAEEYLANQSNIWDKHQNFSAQVHSWKNCLSQLESLIPLLEPFAVMELIKNTLCQRLSKLQEETAGVTQQLETAKTELHELKQQVESQTPENLIAERNWWEQAWQAIPDKFQPEVPSTGLFTLKFLRKVKAQFDLWQKELEQEENYLKRYQNFVQDWIEKLRHPSAQDRNELKQIYIDNANVIGITCVQAARGDFSKEFPIFDVVIIDEVSKCTPPELLIPALKGKKLVLVGDHRQLPPMLRDETIEDIAEKMGSTKDELSFIKKSLFKMQFESADESIKQMLTIQYRMHPQIMGAINQFYEHRLNCGILEPDTKRAHNLAGKTILENHHILWVKTPVAKGFTEEKEGTSRFNIREIDVIESLCEQIEAAWFPKIAEGQPQKEIGIITFYGAQLKLMKERIDSEKFPSLNIRTGTVDIFQGMERPIIIVSTVCNNNRGDIGFAKEPERVNVAFSRAQELLIVVGCHDLFTQQPGKVGSMYQEVSKVVRRYAGFIDVSNILG